MGGRSGGRRRADRSSRSSKQGKSSKPSRSSKPSASGSGTRRGGRDRGLDGRQVEGRQAVRELLLAQRRAVHELWISSDLRDHAGVSDIAEIAAARRVRIEYVAPSRLEREAASESPQGVLARAAPLPEASLQELLTASDRPFLVALDHVTDPGNVGAIVRVADGAGATGVVLPRHRAARVTPTVAKASAGAVEHVPIALVGGLPAALREMSDRGLWLIGLDDAADRSVFDLDAFRNDARCVVLGAEGAGLSRLVRERCDVLAAIPMNGRVSSLNVSAAAAVSLYELSRS